jgi:hypothetical protein
MNTQSQKPKVTQGSKNALRFILSSVASHNQKNLQELAVKKDPSKRTIAEKQAIEWAAIKFETGNKALASSF